MNVMRQSPKGTIPSGTYRTGFASWRARTGGLSEWKLSGAVLESGRVVLDPGTAARGEDPCAPGSYEGGDFYNGGVFLVSEALGPELATSFAAAEAIPSWNADAPPGTWLEILLRARSAGTWTRWYNLGVWAADDSTVGRHSVKGQEDAEGVVRCDTLAVTRPADALQARVRLFSVRDGAVPALRFFSIAYSGAKGEARSAVAGDPYLWDRVIPGVPCSSQMVYPDGGDVWCSPTAVSMVLGYWRGETGDRESRVRAAVAGVRDRVYDGCGNWSFNAAYAGSPGYEAQVARFDSLARLEPWIASGIPVVMSVSWNAETGRPLSNAPVARSRGHLTLLVGFDRGGNPVMNEPAAKSDDEVRRIYPRAELEDRWLEASGGAVYLIFPEGRLTPELPGN
ncbi:MAG: C39 family peptidase [Spirochaetes bacterium]|nr:C39 family peptidase [Spirochaetota bacterium]